MHLNIDTIIPIKIAGTRSISPNPSPKGNSIRTTEPPIISPSTVNIILKNNTPAFNAIPIKRKNKKSPIIIFITYFPPNIYTAIVSIHV